MPLLPFLNKTFVYGPINIEVNITSASGVEKVEFYINGDLVGEDTEEPYEYMWSPITCGRYTIKTIVYDNTGQNASDSIKIFKWRAHPLLILASILPILILLLETLE